MQALETRYAGCNFRSRLEARWALFFDRMHIPWEYEPDGFATLVGNYLPDFKVHIPQPEDHGQHFQWFEVKPDNFLADRRHAALAAETKRPLVVARGMPRSYLAQLTEETLVTRAPLLAFGLEEGPIAVAFHDPERSSFVDAEMFCGLGDNRIWEVGCPSELTLAIVRHHHPAPSDMPGFQPYTTWAPHRSDAVDDAYAAAKSARFGT